MRTSADHAEYDWHAGPSDDQIAAEMEADRCQQLAALEREIGRAVIGREVLINASNRLHYLALRIRCNDDFAARDLLYSLIPESDPDEIIVDGVELIARWRELHAEGAEGGKG